MQHCKLARGRQLKDRTRTLRNSISLRGRLAALAVVAAKYGRAIEVAVRDEMSFIQSIRSEQFERVDFRFLRFRPALDAQ